MQITTSSTLVMPFTNSNSSHSISSTKSRRLSLSLSNREIPEPLFANLNGSHDSAKNITTNAVMNTSVQQSIEISRRVTTPEINEETEEDNNSTEEEGNSETEWMIWLQSKQTAKCWLSLAFCLILLLFFILLTCAWLVAFGVTIQSTNDKIIVLDALNSEKDIDNTINSMLILSDSVGSQLKIMINNSIDDLKIKEFNFFGVFKSIAEKELDLISSIYVADVFGNKVGVYYYGGELCMMNSSQHLNHLTFCRDWTTKSECQMGVSKTVQNEELGIEFTLPVEEFHSTQIIGLNGKTVRLLKKWIDSKSNFYYLAIDISLERLSKKALVPTLYFSQYGNIMLMDTNSTSILGSRFNFSTSQIEAIKKMKPSTCSKHIITQVESDVMFLKRICLGENFDLTLITSIPNMYLAGSLVSPMIITFASCLILLVIFSLLSVLVTWLFLRPLHEIFQLVDETYGVKESFSGVPRRKNFKIPLLRGLFEFKFLREMIGRLISPLDKTPSFVQKHPIIKYESDVSLTKSIDLKTSQQFERSKSQSKDGIGSFLSNSFKFAKKRHQQAIEEREVICIGLSLDGLSQIASSNMSEAVHFLMEFCEKITTMSSQKGCKAGFLSADVVGLFYNFSNTTFPIDKVISNCHFFIEQLEKIKIKHPIKYRLSIFQQKLLCGLSTPTIFTPLNTDYLLETIRKMNDICCELEISMTIPEYFRQAIHEKYYHRFVGNVFLYNRESTFSKNIDKNEEIYNIYEVGEEKTVQQDQEWMYELQEKTKKHKWDEYNRSHQLFEEGKVEEARDLLNTIINEQNQLGTIDQATLQLFRICEISINNRREEHQTGEDLPDENTESSMGTDYIL